MPRLLIDHPNLAHVVALAACVLLLVFAVKVLAPLMGDGGAENYCHRFYRPGGSGTPTWAIEPRYFNDLRSCVRWYEDSAAQLDR